MSFKLYNSLTQKKETFEPLEAGKVRMYVCGITAYDECHLGHARAAVVFDVLYRYLQHKDYDVTYVRNFTDVDDKIIKKSQETGESCEVISERYIHSYKEQMGRLGVAEPKHEPKATEHIPEMLELVSTLEKKGLAYAAEGDVFYSVRQFSGYGKLSHKKIDDLESGARIEINESKKDPLDFVLWKAAKPEEPKWTSPWGEGRPGWHLECSAMSMKYLGPSFDIHGGGRDLIFPHHENEIAQSEGTTGKPFARYWVHNGFVNINTEKMSKSLGNIRAITAILDHWDAEVVRYFLLSAHYRSALDFTDETMTNAQEALTRFYETLLRLQKAPKGKEGTHAIDYDRILAKGMDDDLNTLLVIGEVFKYVRQMNAKLDEKGNWNPENLQEILRGMKQISNVLGIFGSDPASFLQRIREKATARSELTETEIEELIQKRLAARKGKEWQRADEIRDELVAHGVTLKDNPDGTTSWTMTS